MKPAKCLANQVQTRANLSRPGGAPALFSPLGASDLHLGVFGGLAHGLRVDVVQLAASTWAPDLVAPSVLKELLLAMSHRSRNGAVVTHGDERKPFQNTVDGHHVGYWIRPGWLSVARALGTAVAH